MKDCKVNGVMHTEYYFLKKLNQLGRDIAVLQKDIETHEKRNMNLYKKYHKVNENNSTYVYSRDEFEKMISDVKSLLNVSKTQAIKSLVESKVIMLDERNRICNIFHITYFIDMRFGFNYLNSKKQRLSEANKFYFEKLTSRELNTNEIKTLAISHNIFN